MAMLWLHWENLPPKCPTTSRKRWMSRISSSHEIDPETIDAVIELGRDDADALAVYASHCRNVPHESKRATRNSSARHVT